MDRKAAINFARVGAQKIWVGTLAIKPNAKTGAHHHGALESVIYVVRGKARMRWGEHLEYVAEANSGRLHLHLRPTFRTRKSTRASGRGARVRPGAQRQRGGGGQISISSRSRSRKPLKWGSTRFDKDELIPSTARDAASATKQPRSDRRMRARIEIASSGFALLAMTGHGNIANARAGNPGPFFTFGHVTHDDRALRRHLCRGSPSPRSDQLAVLESACRSPRSILSVVSVCPSPRGRSRSRRAARRET